MSTFDRIVLGGCGLLALGSWLLLRWSRSIDHALADLGTVD